MTKNQKRFLKIIIIFISVFAIFFTVDFILSEIADLKAYEDATAVSDDEWEKVYDKLRFSVPLSDGDYSLIMSQTGLGKPAVDKLVADGETHKINCYREYYLKDKDFSCVREGVFACHEKITDESGNLIENPPFADIRDGDIILTLSIHSLGWRHGHAAIVVNADAGITAEAVMIGEKSDYGCIDDWREYPLVAVLRPKNTDEKVSDDIARFTSDNLIGLYYSLTAGIFGGRDSESIPAATQCAHFAWFAYNAYGIDIDSDGGLIITPYDILKSDKLETVQIYGNIKEL